MCSGLRGGSERKATRYDRHNGIIDWIRPAVRMLPKLLLGGHRTFPVGFFAALVGVTKTILGEISTDENRARLFSLVGHSERDSEASRSDDGWTSVQACREIPWNSC